MISLDILALLALSLASSRISGYFRARTNWTKIPVWARRIIVICSTGGVQLVFNALAGFGKSNTLATSLKTKQGIPFGDANLIR